jgi:small GTP-binding protein
LITVVPTSDPLTYQKKICLLGDFAVGKTSLIRRFVEGRFDERYLTTVGVVVSRKRLSFTSAVMHLLIWDLAGGRDFSQSGYLTGLAGALLVCDLTRAETLAAYRPYTSQVRQANPEAQIILLANKSDLTDARSVPEEQLLSIAGELDAPLVITSAKTGERVEEAFIMLAERLTTTAAL